jgi:hypothetical protein
VSTNTSCVALSQARAARRRASASVGARSSDAAAVAEDDSQPRAPVAAPPPGAAVAAPNGVSHGGTACGCAAARGAALTSMSPRLSGGRGRTALTLGTQNARVGGSAAEARIVAAEARIV